MQIYYLPFHWQSQRASHHITLQTNVFIMNHFVTNQPTTKCHSTNEAISTAGESPGWCHTTTAILRHPSTLTATPSPQLMVCYTCAHSTIEPCTMCWLSALLKVPCNTHHFEPGYELRHVNAITGAMHSKSTELRWLQMVLWFSPHTALPQSIRFQWALMLWSHKWASKCSFKAVPISLQGGLLQQLRPACTKRHLAKWCHEHFIN